MKTNLVLVDDQGVILFVGSRVQSLYCVCRGGDWRMEGGEAKRVSTHERETERENGFFLFLFSMPSRR